MFYLEKTCVVLTSRPVQFLFVPWFCCGFRPQILFKLIIGSYCLWLSAEIRRRCWYFGVLTNRQLLGFLKDRFRITVEFLQSWWFGGDAQAPLRAVCIAWLQGAPFWLGCAAGHHSHGTPCEQCFQVVQCGSTAWVCIVLFCNWYKWDVLSC